MLVAAILLAGLAIAPCARAQVDQRTVRGGQPVPTEVIIDDLRESYARLFAEEVVVRFRAPQLGERAETFSIRVDPGPDPETRPARVLLELGRLRVLFAGGRMIAVNEAAPDHFVLEPYEGPITPELVARLLPPLPLPQLALARVHNDMLATLTPYTIDIRWSDGMLDAGSRPPIMGLRGSGALAAGGSGGVVGVELLANADDARLMRIRVQMRAGNGESVLDLSMRPIESGDPATWSIDTTGRERVASLADLRPLARAGPIAIGSPVPDLTFTRADASPWSLYSALRAAEALVPPGQEPRPVALILVRLPAGQMEADRRLRAASAGYAALHSPQAAGVAAASVAAAGITPLGEFNRDRLDAARATWQNLTASIRAGARDELLWGHSPSQTLDLFDPGANAVLVLIGYDRRLRDVIPLDDADSADIIESLTRGPE